MSESATLITGVNGLIGHALAHRLAAGGRPVVGMDRGVAFDGVGEFPVVEAELADVHRLYATLRKYDISQIVHCGGISGPMLARDNPHHIFRTNVGGTLDILEAARLCSVHRVIFTSSISAYGDQGHDAAVREDSRLLGSDAYGASKVCGEVLLRAYANYGVEGVALRLSSVYGPRRTTECLIGQMIRDCLAGRTTRLPHSSEECRQFIYVDDAVSAIVLALDIENLPYSAYNVSGMSPVTLEQVADTVRSILPDTRVEFGNGHRCSGNTVGPLDLTAAQRDLGYHPEVTLRDGIVAYTNWLRQARN